MVKEETTGLGLGFVVAAGEGEGGGVMEGGRVSNIHATIKEEGVRVLEDWR
jgi:hypothetical protein